NAPVGEQRIEWDVYSSDIGCSGVTDFYFSAYFYMKPYDYGITLFQLEGTVLPNYSPLFGLSTDDAYNNNLVLYYIQDITQGDAGVLQASNMKFPTNQWVHVEWAQTINNDGTSSVKVWINGDQLFDYSGHLDYEGRPWYFNIDLYRGNGMTNTEATMYVDDVQIWA
ncbi:MAG: polysaccharide lyase, partial [Candidatus Bathyarchaeota archaeon]|nr:polysaccharide lyase [Candidatus Bathyarchaeota archaeon]